MKSKSAVIAALVFALLGQQSFAAANSSTVDPARDRIGQIVYPLGVHPPKDASVTKGVLAKDKTAVKHHKPKPKADDNE
jgi:hypothetical protein